MIVGVDYGSKMAGTTVLCYTRERQIRFLQSAKKRDADIFLLENFDELHPDLIYLDAPLSLPRGFFEKERAEYFYRQCDKEVGAMSPMFLGGLTARAIKLRDSLPRYTFYEAYPGGLARELGINKEQYKKTVNYIPQVSKAILTYLNEALGEVFIFESIPKNWHQVDALLALTVGFRHAKGLSLCYGDEKEGVIYI